MLRRWGLTALLLSGASVGTWKGGVAAYFGRVDVATWSADNPAPPPPRSELGRHSIQVVSTRRIVPSPGLSGRLSVQRANNNLDVTRHDDGRVYLAWRTAPNHFAGTETIINVASSSDEINWDYEASFHESYDLREPRLLSLGGRLFLYVARLGSNPFAFEPKGLSMASKGEDGHWGGLQPVGLRGAIAWRVKPFHGEALMIAYTGGDHLYSLWPQPMKVELLRSPDGQNWEPFSPSGAVVSEGGGSETDFAFDAGGSLFAVIRNEAGDSSGWGSKLCRASWMALERWTCKADPRKFDSPLVFEHDGEIYVVARRNVTSSGAYDVASGPPLLRTIQNELSYITTAKRCSLWRFIRGEDRLAFVLDLPSRGDTCFPSVISTAQPDTLAIYDYSSDIDGPDLPWSAGQRRETFVYRHEVVFRRMEPAAAR
jgi:hypothetical protein